MITMSTSRGDLDSLRPIGGIPARFIAVSPRKSKLLRLPLTMGDTHLHNLPHNATQCNPRRKVGKWENMDAQSSKSAAENSVFYSVSYSVFCYSFPHRWIGGPKPLS